MRYLALGLSMVLFTSVLVYAQHDMCPMRGHKEGPGGVCPLEFLDNLTPDQKTKIEDIRIETQKTIIPIKGQIELKQIDLQKEMKNDRPDKDRILKIAQDIHQLEWQIKKAQIEEKIKIHSLLTPEQREELKMPKHK
ncbi:MAG: periplasmic heavy metal sensor, partial [candidate division WOR-3 bacterium]